MRADMKQGKRHYKSASRVLKMIGKHPQPGLFFVLSGSDNILNFGTTITTRAQGGKTASVSIKNSNINSGNEELATLRKENEMLRERLADKDNLLADKEEQIAFLRSLVMQGDGLGR